MSLINLHMKLKYQNMKKLNINIIFLQKTNDNLIIIKKKNKKNISNNKYIQIKIAIFAIDDNFIVLFELKNTQIFCPTVNIFPMSKKFIFSRKLFRTFWTQKLGLFTTFKI